VNEWLFDAFAIGVGLMSAVAFVASRRYQR
jgi:hypothetical protein